MCVYIYSVTIMPKVIITQKFYYDCSYSFIHSQRSLENMCIKLFFPKKYRSLQIKLEYNTCMELLCYK